MKIFVKFGFLTLFLIISAVVQSESLELNELEFNDFTEPISNEFNIIYNNTLDYGAQKIFQPNNVFFSQNGHMLVFGDYQSGSVYIQKTDVEGNQFWIRSYNFGTGENNMFTSLEDEASDLYTGGKFNPRKSFVLKVNQDGDPIWNWTSPCSDLAADCGVSHLAIDNLDGNIFATDYQYFSQSESSYIFHKFASNGTKIFSREYEIQKLAILSLIPLETGGFVISGYVGNDNENDGFVAEINSTGFEVWHKTYQYDTLTSADEIITDMIITNNGNYLMCGSATQGDLRMWFLLTDNNGNVVINKGLEDDYLMHGCSDIVEKEEGGYLIYGLHINPPGARRQALLIDTDKYGNILSSFNFDTSIDAIGWKLFNFSDKDLLLVNHHQDVSALPTIKISISYLRIVLLDRITVMTTKTVIRNEPTSIFYESKVTVEVISTKTESVPATGIYLVIGLVIIRKKYRSKL